MQCAHYNCKEFTLDLEERRPEEFAILIEVISRVTYSIATQNIDRLRQC